MNKLKTLVISLVLIVSSGVASAISVSRNMSLTSDYIWRGMTQNDGEVAIQSGFDLETDSGFYLGTWAGSANFGGGESLELDYYGGYAGSVGDIGYDIGFIEVTYPGASGDFSETYLGLDVMGVGLFYQLETSSVTMLKYLTVLTLDLVQLVSLMETMKTQELTT